jgi:hypothetical protein
MDYPFLGMLDGLALVDDATGEGGSFGRTGAFGSSAKRASSAESRHSSLPSCANPVRWSWCPRRSCERRRR